MFASGDLLTHVPPFHTKDNLTDSNLSSTKTDKISLDKCYSHTYIYSMKREKELKQASTNDYFTVEEAAQELGIKPTAIRNYLYDGKLTTFKFKTLTLVKREEVESWKERQR